MKKQEIKNIAASVEDLGYWGLFRSDHFTNRNPPDMDSLELWTSLTWLADNTKRIHFGSMVSPFSFRHPAMTARTASADRAPGPKTPAFNRWSFLLFSECGTGVQPVSALL